MVKDLMSWLMLMLSGFGHDRGVKRGEKRA